MKNHLELIIERTHIFPIIGWRFCHLSNYMFLLSRRYCNCLGKAYKNNCANSSHHLPHQRMQKMIAPTNTTSAINWVPPKKKTCVLCMFEWLYFQTCNFPWIRKNLVKVMLQRWFIQEPELVNRCCWRSSIEKLPHLKVRSSEIAIIYLDVG